MLHKSGHGTQYHRGFDGILVASGTIKAESVGGVWVCLCTHTHTSASTSGHPGAGLFLVRNQDYAPGQTSLPVPSWECPDSVCTICLRKHLQSLTAFVGGSFYLYPIQTSFFSVLCLLSSFSHHCKVLPSFSMDPDFFGAPA